MDAGIPEAITRLTLKFRYNDLASLEALFDGADGNDIAAVVLEAETMTIPEPGFLESLVVSLCRARGALVILDESITGFRWHNGGARAFHRMDPTWSSTARRLAMVSQSPRWSGVEISWSWVGFGTSVHACFLCLRLTAPSHRVSPRRAR